MKQMPLHDRLLDLISPAVPWNSRQISIFVQYLVVVLILKCRFVGISRTNGLISDRESGNKYLKLRQEQPGEYYSARCVAGLNSLTLNSAYQCGLHPESVLSRALYLRQQEASLLFSVRSSSIFWKEFCA